MSGHQGDGDPPSKSIKEYAIERLFPTHSDEQRAVGDLKAFMEQRMAETARVGVLHQSLTEIADEATKASRRLYRPPGQRLRGQALRRPEAHRRP